MSVKKKLKERGLDHIVESMEAHQDDFLHAAECAEELIKEFDRQGIDRGSALGRDPDGDHLSHYFRKPKPRCCARTDRVVYHKRRSGD